MSDHTSTKLSTKNSLQCTLCEKQYASKYSLSQHIGAAHRRVTCKICKKQFRNFKSLQSHELYLHGDDSISIKCFKCRKLMYSGQIDTDPDCRDCRVERIRKGPSVIPKVMRKPQKNVSSKCTICEKVYCNKTAVKTHMLNVHVGRRVKCNICNVQFPVFVHLQRHQLKLHGKESVSIKCAACVKLMFRGKSDTDPDCQQCVEKRHALESSGKTNQFIQKLERKPKVCEICGVSAFYIAQHRRTHKDTRSFECELCGKGFKQKTGLYTHMRYHSDERPNACDLCDKKFKFLHHLRYHKQTVHSDERPHVCDICHKGFKLRQQLGYHKKIHGQT